MLGRYLYDPEHEIVGRLTAMSLFLYQIDSVPPLCWNTCSLLPPEFTKHELLLFLIDCVVQNKEFRILSSNWYN